MSPRNRFLSLFALIFIPFFLISGNSSAAPIQQEAQENATLEIYDDLDPEKLQFVGTFVEPKHCKVKACPGLVIWEGSGGGVPVHLAKHYAQQGYASLAISYFTSDPKAVQEPYLPFLIDQVPLEIFTRAIDWTINHPSVIDDKVAIIGGSRGGEAALLVGSFYSDRLAGVVAHRPSLYAWSSIGTGTEPLNHIREEHSSWSKDGEGIAYIPFDTPKNRKLICDKDPIIAQSLQKIRLNNPAFQPQTSVNTLAHYLGGCERKAEANEDGLIENRAVLEFSLVYEHLLGPEREVTDDELERARIKVENIKTPLFASGGENDGLWPAARWVEEMQEIRKAKNTEYQEFDQFVVAKGAGHLNWLPGSPAPVYFPWKVGYSRYIDQNGDTQNNVPDLWYIGGDETANADAYELINDATLEFLKKIFE